MINEVFNQFYMVDALSLIHPTGAFSCSSNTGNELPVPPNVIIGNQEVRRPFRT
jgi:hypothetical protein